MTITEIFLRIAGSQDAAVLPDAAKIPEKNAKMVSVIERVTSECAPSQEWKELADAFGLPPQDSPGDIREALLLKLTSLHAESALNEEPSMLKETAEDTESPPEHPVEEPPKKQQSKTLKTVLRIWNIFTTVLVAIVVVLAVTLAGVRVFGLQVFSVLSGSMEPEYHVGALIYVQKVDPFTLEVGDDITFLLDEETVATHRIVGILPDENDPTVIRFRTQGIANDQEDGTPVHYKNVVGKPVFTIPYLGYVASFIQDPPGTYIAISIGALILFLVFLPDLFAEEDKDREKQKKPKKKRAKDPEEPKDNTEER